MVIRIEADTVSVPANAKEQLIASFTPPSGKVQNFLEIGLSASGAGYFSIYFSTEKICRKIEKTALDIDKRRILVDWSLKVGDRLDIVFTDTSGAANSASYIAVFEEKAAP
jgi:hypothetical protein